MRWEGTDLDEGLGRERQREEGLVKMLQAGTQLSKENQGRSSNNAERKQDMCAFCPGPHGGRAASRSLLDSIPELQQGQG